MIYELISIISLCALVTYSIDCAKKQRNPGAGSAIPSSRRAADTPKSRSIQQPLKVQANHVLNSNNCKRNELRLYAGQKLTRIRTLEPEFDEGGYEVCPDMTPSQLAKAETWIWRKR
uniref:Secreted protein n=1 Tax=Haemonchus contortus TaxID=6289 RepID=A0A7I4XT03_HAECO